ncbi:FtsB family cell division protein [Melghirimyces algeriensis]|uniref:FtsB family cell division protein n=1 Tax=Melghirimyces algeriensis TaxID=910412 RepID=UPI00163DCA1D|nr:septum formation initiator family protein [Melghirimyces algeriensis]
MNRGSMKKIVSFRPSQPSQSGQERSSRSLLPFGVRCRRWIWLVVMVLLLIWSGNQLFVQAKAIHTKEEALLEKKKQLVQLQKERKKLKQDLNRLRDEQVLFELARNMGYKKPGEEMLQLKELE